MILAAIGADVRDGDALLLGLGQYLGRAVQLVLGIELPAAGEQRQRGEHHHRDRHVGDAHLDGRQRQPANRDTDTDDANPHERRQLPQNFRQIRHTRQARQNGKQTAEQDERKNHGGD